MFDIGFWELSIIAVVALVVIGPERLPGVARTAGKWLGKARRFINQVKSDLDVELRQEELKKALERDAGLDEIKQIMNSDQFVIEEEDSSQYQVKAIPDEAPQEQFDSVLNEYEPNPDDEYADKIEPVESAEPDTNPDVKEESKK